jgi:hypothetical protein
MSSGFKTILKLEEILAATILTPVFQQATGAGAIAMAIAPGAQWELLEVRIHLSAAGGAGDLTFTDNDGVSAVFDTIFLTEDMTLLTDFPWQPDSPMVFDSDDVVDIAWPNAGAKTYGVKVIYRLL